MTPAPAGSHIRAASPADLPALEGLLRAADLPLAGVAEALAGFVVAERDGVLAGVAGLEVHGDEGVLRSVAVAPSLRGEGLGARLTQRILDEARRRGLRRLYLLTTTADVYFLKHGFRPVERTEASEAVRQSVEFREACPASAVAMVVDLRKEGTVDER